ncbi:helix-turn-helix domain-containing protein [Nonomuraea insulae]|uniref:Helix-turn-helix domain-containing protein n=1 Tax=Nonomuraea insulae TaxID=1616787 RepID=A0ABW1CUH2_9ACTN
MAGRSGVCGASCGDRGRTLDAAEGLFAGGGYEATPTAVIARRATAPKGLIFRYFPHKIDVLVALVDERTLVEESREIDGVPGAPAGTRGARRSGGNVGCPAIRWERGVPGDPVGMLSGWHAACYRGPHPRCGASCSARPTRTVRSRNGSAVSTAN